MIQESDGSYWITFGRDVGWEGQRAAHFSPPRWNVVPEKRAGVAS
ncbi:MAG: hypothetical protein ACTHMB_17010 [Candidatus Binatia bacterium]